MPELDHLYQSVQHLLPWVTATGILMALASMVAIPLLVVRMPADYFVAKRRPHQPRGALSWLTWGLRNVLAIVLILAGALMLVLPGQGVLTIMIGIACSTFPGKYTLERRIATRPKVLATLNWIRRKYGHEPLQAPNQSAMQAPMQRPRRGHDD